MYKLDPKLVERKWRHQNGSKSGTYATTARDANINRTINRLTARLEKIQKDILFDENEAERRWAESQIALSKESAERRRLGIREETSIDQRTSPIDGPLRDDESKDQDNDDMLGNLFVDHSVSNGEASKGAHIIDADGTGGEVVAIRDFGKWTGMNPRRVFEEACKAR